MEYCGGTVVPQPFLLVADLSGEFWICPWDSGRRQAWSTPACAAGHTVWRAPPGVHHRSASGPVWECPPDGSSFPEVITSSFPGGIPNWNVKWGCICWTSLSPSLPTEIVYTQESEVAQSCRHFVTPWNVAYQAAENPWDFPGKSTGLGCHFLLQGIFLTQRLNPDLPHCRQMRYHLSHQESPKVRKAPFCLSGNLTVTLSLPNPNKARQSEYRDPLFS